MMAATKVASRIMLTQPMRRARRHAPTSFRSNNLSLLSGAECGNDWVVAGNGFNNVFGDDTSCNAKNDQMWDGEDKEFKFQTICPLSTQKPIILVTRFQIIIIGASEGGACAPLQNLPVIFMVAPGAAQPLAYEEPIPPVPRI
jgi:hypothetical protein